MENNDPLFDKIGRNAKRISQKPSKDAWTKLSARLDKHERPAARRRTLPGLGIMSIAASLLLLVGLVFVISQTVLNPSTNFDSANNKALPIQVEDLPLLASNESITSPQLAEYQRKINANPRGVIKEGGFHKKLVAQSFNHGQMVDAKTAASAGENVVSLSNFNWILGDWKSTHKNGVSTETWRLIAPGHFEGTGNFINDNHQMIFTENMALIQRDDKIYFEAITQAAGENVAYLLEKVEGNKALFYNESIDFPTHVLITRTNSRGFKIVFKNIPPVVVPNKNILLKNNRNTIESKEITRTMDQKI